MSVFLVVRSTEIHSKTADMNASASQPAVSSDRARVQRASALVLGAGLGVSLLLHLGAAAGAGAYWDRARQMAASSGGKPIDIDDAIALSPPPVERELTLGREEAKHASISWLGVVEDPVEGDAPESEVEQAQFTRAQGDAPVTTAPRAQAAPEQVQTQAPAQDQPPAQLAQEPTEQPVEAEEPIESPPVQTPEVAPDPAPKLEPMVVEVEEIDPEAPVSNDVVTVEPTSESDEAPPVDEVPEQAAERAAEDAPEQGQRLPTVDQAASPPDQEPSEPRAAAEQTNAQEQSDRVQLAGKQGVLDERESAASIIKRSVKVEADDLHKPLVGKGLEIIPVEPRFPASVRFTQLPRNPVLLITFNAQGRVTRVRFLTEGKRVYDTGSRLVDEPLFNAVYQWRAKGEEIDKLKDQGQGATLEIPMRVIFRED